MDDPISNPPPIPARTEDAYSPTDITVMKDNPDDGIAGCPQNYASLRLGDWRFSPTGTGGLAIRTAKGEEVLFRREDVAAILAVTKADGTHRVKLR